MAPDRTDSWGWIEYLPKGDVAELAAEVQAAILATVGDEASVPIEEVVDAWRETALSLKDPHSREALLKPSGHDDYVEVGRPEPSSSD